jgi:isoleucyl-tRNA synthetase
MEQDKINAYMTLYTTLVTFSKIAAPMVPFITESIYRNLVCTVDPQAKKSVHLCSFPVADESMIDAELEESMDKVLRIVILGRAARNTAAVKNRQPIGNMYVKSESGLDQYYIDIIEDELNVKNVIFQDDLRAFTSYTFKPQLKTVGPKYGKHLNSIRTYLSEIDGSKAMDDLETNGEIKFVVDGDAEVSLTKDDLLIDVSEKGGFVTEEGNYLTVVLDTNLTPELIEEGFVREIIPKIQTMRKEAGFEVMDHIRISLNGNDKLLGIVKKNEEQISTKLLADEIASGKDFAFSKEWDINGEKVTISLEKI